MTSEVEICNRAIDKVGGNSIVSLTDNTEEARILNRNYAGVRDYLLRTDTWNFAKAKQTLAELTPPDFGFAKAFQLPTDWLRNVEINGDCDGKLQFDIVGDQLHTDEDSINLVFIQRITDPTKFDVLFTQQLIDELAKVLAYPVTQNRSMRQDMAGEALTTGVVAKAVNGQDSHEERRESSKFLQARV